MKNITKIGIVIIGLTLATNIAFAQSALAQLDLQQQYQSTLVTLIGLLQAQVQSLLAQLQVLQTNQTTMQTNQNNIQTKVDTITQNTTPVQNFGSVTPAPVPVTAPVITPTIMTINTEKLQGNYPQYPYGWYEFKVTVLDQNGNAIDQHVHMDNPNDNLYAFIQGDFDGHSIVNGNGSIFQYQPKSQGTTTITFTSGSLIKSVDVVH